MRSIIIQPLAALALSGLLTLAQSFEKTGNADTGRKTYVAVGCYECHGLQGQGGSSAPIGSYGPRLAPAKLPVAAIRAYIRHPSGGMPPYSPKVLSDSQIDDIYAFLKSVPAPRPVKDIQLLNQ